MLKQQINVAYGNVANLVINSHKLNKVNKFVYLEFMYYICGVFR